MLSADSETGKQSYQRVVRRFVRTSPTLLKIKTANGQSVEATPEHLFWVKGKGFVPAKRLARGDLLQNSHGRLVAVQNATARRGRIIVYNFEVAHTHTYFAGGWWVHNLCPPTWVVDKRTFLSWVKQLDDRQHLILTSVDEANQLVAQARGYGAPVEASPNDLAGHPGTNWPTPHIHIGEGRFHIGVPAGYVLPP